MAFDPYESWLGIPANRRPPTHYDLLGLTPDDSDAEAIEQAALRRMSKVRQHQIGPLSDQSQVILAELARARLILMDPERRADYDAKILAKDRNRSDSQVVLAQSPNDSALPSQSGDDAAAHSIFGTLVLDAAPSDAPVAPATVPPRAPSPWKRRLGTGFFLASHCLLIWGFCVYAWPLIMDWRYPPPAPQRAPGAQAALHPQGPADVPNEGRRAPLPISPNPPAMTNALKFDGATRITIASSDDFDMSRADYTIFAWIKTEHGGTIFSKTAPIGGWAADGKRLFIGDGRLAFEIGGDKAISTSTRVDDNRWHTVAMTYQHREHVVRLYIDGNGMAPQKIAPKGEPTGHIARIGYTASDIPFNRNCYIGWISTVHYYDRALTTAAIKRLTVNAEPNDSEPLAQWNLRTRRGASVPDETGNGHLGQLEAIPTSEPERVLADVRRAKSQDRAENKNRSDRKALDDQSSQKPKQKGPAPETPENVLKRSGLKAAGAVYILEREVEVQQKAVETRLLAEKLRYFLMQQQQAAINPEAMVAQFDTMVQAYRAEIRAVDEELKGFRRWHGIAYNDIEHQQQSFLNEYKKRLELELRQHTDSFNALRRQGFGRQAMQAVNDSVRDTKLSFELALREFRELVDATLTTFDELARSEEIKKALLAVGKKPGAKPTLRLSDGFSKNVKLLERFESLSGKSGSDSSAKKARSRTRSQKTTAR